MFQFVEELLDEVMLSVDVPINAALHLSVTLGRNVGADISGLSEFDKGFGVVTTISDEGAGSTQALNQRTGSFFVRCLAGRQSEPDRQTIAIYDGVDLGAQSSTRTTDGVIRGSFFPPAACWWARMMELSINACDCGDRSARASKIRSHTPTLAHRLKRL